MQGFIYVLFYVLSAKKYLFLLFLLQMVTMFGDVTDHQQCHHP